MDFNNILFRNIFLATIIVRREWFGDQLTSYNLSQFFSKDQLQNIQLEKLNKLLAHCVENVPYYKNRLPSELRSLSELSGLPTLGKDTLREEKDRLAYRVGPNQRFKTSGGSTGAPVTLLKNSDGMALEMAAAWRGYSWAGVKIGDRQARFWGIPRSQREKWRASLIDFVCNRRRVTAFDYSLSKMLEAEKVLKSFEPQYFYGYTSIIKEFAEANAGRSNLRPKAIITTSEVLSTADRKYLEESFSSKVFDEYGCGEVGTIAHECEYQNLHINAENVIVEIVDENNQAVSPGTPGEIVVTDLTNFSMPLIRYKIADYATISADSCGCGRTLPILKGVHGRAYDSLINSSGSKFHGEFFLYIVEDLKKKGFSVNGIQFVQENDLSLTINLVSDRNNIKVIERFIKRALHREFDSQLAIRVKRVAGIPREPSGKLRVVKKMGPA